MTRNFHQLNLTRCRGCRPAKRAGAILAAALLLPWLGLAADPAKVTTRPGREFRFTLASNPTTGYQWQLAKPVAGSCVSLVTNEFVRPKSNLAGAPGKEVWRFKAIRPGEATIELEYARSWEKGVPPVQKTNFVVVVRGAKAAK
jgi:inhibitor of cysteine peptidase